MPDYCVVCGDETPQTSEGEYREATVPVSENPEDRYAVSHAFEVWVCGGCLA